MLGLVNNGDDVFRRLVPARIIEPTSKLCAARVPEGVGITARSYRTVTRRLPVHAVESFREAVAAVRHARRERPGQPAALRRDHAVLRGRQGGRISRARLSKERWLEPQIIVGAAGRRKRVSMMVYAFEGNRAETPGCACRAS